MDALVSLFFASESQSLPGFADATKSPAPSQQPGESLSYIKGKRGRRHRSLSRRQTLSGRGRHGFQVRHYGDGVVVSEMVGVHRGTQGQAIRALAPFQDCLAVRLGVCGPAR